MKTLIYIIGLAAFFLHAATVAGAQASNPPRKDIPDYIVACDVGLMGVDEAKVCNLAVKQLTSEGKVLTADSVAQRVLLIKQQPKK